MILNRKKFFNFISSAQEKSWREDYLILFTYTQRFKATPYDLYSKILNYQKQYFYWNTPSSNLSFIAIDKIYSNDSSLNRNNKKKIENYSNDSDIENITLPLFVGYKKFPLSEKGNVWKDFSDTEWFVPKYLIQQSESWNIFSVNFTLSDLKNNSLYEEIENELSHLFNNNSQKSDADAEKVMLTINADEQEYEKWDDIINTAVDRISKKQFQKVVLARCIKAELSSKPTIYKLFQELVKQFPECYIFAYRNNESVFFGASPEKLLKMRNGIIETDAIAGSIKRGKTFEEDESLATQLSNSKKDIFEHKSVLNYIVNSLSEIAFKIKFDKQTFIKRLSNIQHLWTPIKAEIKSGLSIIDAMEKLYPTPAICGFPKDKALKTIYELENFDRGLYSGVVGWFDKNYHGELAIAIRSALLVDRTLFAFAGCGIVEGSNSLNEFNETELKLKPMLSLFKNEIIH